jgi:hypothetical protein
MSLSENQYNFVIKLLSRHLCVDHALVAHGSCLCVDHVLVVHAAWRSFCLILEAGNMQGGESVDV